MLTGAMLTRDEFSRLHNLKFKLMDSAPEAVDEIHQILERSYRLEQGVAELWYDGLNEIRAGYGFHTDWSYTDNICTPDPACSPADLSPLEIMQKPVSFHLARVRTVRYDDRSCSLVPVAHGPITYFQLWSAANSLIPPDAHHRFIEDFELSADGCEATLVMGS